MIAFFLLLVFFYAHFFSIADCIAGHGICLHLSSFAPSIWEKIFQSIWIMANQLQTLKIERHTYAYKILYIERVQCAHWVCTTLSLVFMKFHQFPLILFLLLVLLGLFSSSFISVSLLRQFFFRLLVSVLCVLSVPLIRLIEETYMWIGFLCSFF